MLDRPVSAYSQNSGTGSAPHCRLNWNVPSLIVDRPKSSTVNPRAIAQRITLQYSRLFGHIARYARKDDAHGTSMVSRQA